MASREPGAKGSRRGKLTSRHSPLSFGTVAGNEQSRDSCSMISMSGVTPRHCDARTTPRSRS